MKTTYYSELLNKHFDTEKECIEAEEAAAKKAEAEKAKKEERAADAKEVEDAYKAAREAYVEANNKLNDFVKKYGSYHYSLSTTTPARDIFNDFFCGFWL